MAFFADLHIHSKYSRATSGNSDLVHAARTAREKGITVVGTGDFTHPGWLNELKDKLEPAEAGLYKLRDDVDGEIPTVPGTVENRTVRFMLQVEISTIYKKDDQTRKVHHLVFAPDFESADRFVDRLSQVGNLEADGRPILGLDSEDLLEITLESGDDCHLIPAHIWTPWFSLFGSKSGFDSLEHCYGSLSNHIFALETGLSSDPPMNWRLSSLDDYTLVSNSDAHSPRKMGREACYFDTDLNYYDMFDSLRTGDDYLGTVEFFPEEGKYHLDGHRKCGVRLDPETTRKLGGECPDCGDPLTVGVLHRVYDLADRMDGARPPSASPFRSLIPLPEILSEIEDVGPNTKTVNRLHRKITSRIGSDFYVLQQAPMDQISDFGRPMLTEAIRRLRNGDVIKEAGYDGEYGRIKLFTEKELMTGNSAGLLFDDLPDSGDEKNKTALLSEDEVPDAGAESFEDESNSHETPLEPDTSILGALDADQRRAAEIREGALLILAGPGTGKTRTLTHRLAHLVQKGADPDGCLTITFTRRAGEEMRNRLMQLLPAAGSNIPVHTFHAFCYETLREHHAEVGLPEDFRIATDFDCVRLIEDQHDVSGTEARTKLENFRSGEKGTFDTSFGKTLTERGYVDFDGLMGLTLKLFNENPSIRAALQERYRWVSVDEYQDINANQYALIRLLAPEGSNLCVIGDPDQSIYGFRGADVQYFQQFEEDYPSSTRVELSRNYRSTDTIVKAADQVVSPNSLVSERVQEPQRDSGRPIQFHEAPTPEAEAEFVVKSIENMIGGTTFFSFDSSRVDRKKNQSWSFSDIGILYRRKDQSKVLAEALSRSGIPFREHTHDRLSEHEVVSYLLDRMESTNSSDRSLLETLHTAADAWLEEHEKTQEFSRHFEGLKELIVDDDIESYRTMRSRVAMGFGVDLWDPRSQGVSLLTLHASKGLEFPVVFVLGCEEGLIPLYWDDGAEGTYPEERRLFFVGMTRAEDQLILSYARHRFQHGSSRERTPSRYIEPIEEDLLERTVTNLENTTRKNDSEDPSSGQLELL